MRFETTLEQIAGRWDFHPAALKEFADEDNLGGYSSNAAEQKWPMGSLWAPEGKTLYALVRALRPERVVEFGTHRGASATHIASALKINGKGWLHCVDPNAEAGDLIPAELRDTVVMFDMTAQEWLQGQPDASIDLIFEDADHSTATTQAVASEARRVLRPGGVLVVHDAAHFLVGEAIRQGLVNAGLSFGVYLADPSDCGLAIWCKDPEPETVALSDQEIDALRAGHTVEVTPDETKINRKRAPDTVTTHKPASKAKAK